MPSNTNPNNPGSPRQPKLSTEQRLAQARARAQAQTQAGSQPQEAAGRPSQRPDSEKRARTPKNPVKYRWFTAFLMVVATIGGCFFLSVYILDTMQDLFGLNQPDADIDVVIPENATTSQISQLLAEKGIINDPYIFGIYAGLKVDEGELLSGEYLFNKNMGYDQLIVAMQYRSIQKEIVTLTFIEGWTLEEIARKLEESKVCSANEFMDYLQSAEPNYEFVDRLPDDPLRFRRFEGYVFPDTYDFYVGEKVESVAAKFLSNFQRKMTPDLEKKMMDLNLTMDETIILASIIQKEAGDYKEMRMVSSVFHNRLRASETYPKLQSDVTIFYVENFIKKRLNIVNQEMYDAYNTYVCDGLSAGPICNPGMDAIEATLNPEESDYYYFVTDVNGKYYYSVTVEEHNANVRLARSQKSESENDGEVHGTGVQGND